MTARVSSWIGVVAAFAAFMPVQATAQLGAAVAGVGEAVNKKLDQNAATITAAGQGSSTAQTGKGAATAGKNKNSGLAESLTKQEVVLEIGLDVLNSFSAALAAEAADRDMPAKRNRCVSNLAAGNEMAALMNSRAAELDKLAKSTVPDDQKLMEAIASEVASRRAAFEVSRCGPPIEARKSEEYHAIGALGGGFTIEQYMSLRERVTPYCEANAVGRDVVDNPKLVYSDSEKIAMNARCRTLLPNLRKVLQPVPAQS